MRILVQKFGGAVLSDPERVRAAAEIVARAVQQGYSVVAVASAMGKTTNQLLELTRDFSVEESGRELDLLLSAGEQISASLLAIALNSNGLPARSFTGGQAGIFTDDIHGSASITNVETDNILKCLNEGTVAVVTGYQGVTSTNEVTTLGRGGSDTTAIALAVALKAERCDVYKDVCGVFSADPKLCETPIRLERMSLAEMRAFANAGAQVLCPAAMEIAVRNKVTLRVRSVYHPNDEGTLIGGETYGMPFCGIACEDKLDVFSANPASSLKEAKAMNSLLRELTGYGASAELVRKICKKTQRRRYLAVGNRHVHNTHQIIAESTMRHGIKTDFRKSLAKLSLVGEFENPAYTMHRAVNVLLKEQICPRFFCLEGSVRLSLLLPQTDVKVATELLHGDFMNDCITKCGGTNIASSLKGAYPRFGAERLVASNPELVILPCEARGTGILKKTPWNLLQAVKAKRFHFLPDREHDYLSRPTLRIIEGLEWLSAKLHPDKAEQLATWKKSAQF